MFEFKDFLLFNSYWKKMKPRVFICGASGLLGKDLCSYFKNQNIDYKGTYCNNSSSELIKVDFNKTDEIENAMLEFETTVCINCIVERRVNICEDDWENIKKINIDIPNRISKICGKLNIHLIHISTDYVFDGKNPPYLPNDHTNPLQNYGISKLISENRVFSHCKKTTIIRVSVLFTENIQNLEDNAVTLIGKKVLNRIEKSKEDNYSVRKPNYIPDFCHFIGDIVKEPRFGIFHYYNPNINTTKYKIANLISDFLNKPILNHIQCINCEKESIEDVERPLDTSLIDDKYDIKKFPFTLFEKCIEKCFQKLYHPPLFIEKPPEENIFFLLDLDGTLVDTDKIHYHAYHCVLLNKYNIDLNFDDFEKAIDTNGLETFFKETYFPYFSEDIIKEIKKEKKEYMLQYDLPIYLIKNAEKIIEYIHKYNIGHAVVTNTNKDIVEMFKKKVPILNLLTNWITREDYVLSKPNSECFELAIKKYGKNEKYIIGFENTIRGYTSLNDVTKCIYIVTDKNSKNYEKFKKKDVYLIDDYEQVFVK